MEDLVLDLTGNAHATGGSCLAVQDQQVDTARVDGGDNCRLGCALDVLNRLEIGGRTSSERQKHRLADGPIIAVDEDSRRTGWGLLGDMCITHNENCSQPRIHSTAAMGNDEVSPGGHGASRRLICQTPPVATVTTAPSAYTHAPANRPNMVAVGTIVWLSSELMFFAALFAMYFTLRAVNPDLWGQETALLNIPFASLNTTILVLSSVTCQLGVFAAERGDVKGLRRWFIITFLMGSFFIGGQVLEYTTLVREGLTLSSNAYGSAFYLTTGFHGMHVTGGLVAFLFVLATTFITKRFTHDQATRAIVVSYYWHFVDVVWIALFFMIYILK